MPIHLAGAFGDLESARILIEEGADLKAKDDTHHGNARAWAEFWRQPEILEFLDKHSGAP